MQSMKEAEMDGLKMFVDFLLNKYGELPDLDITTLIVHFSCENYWSVYVLMDYRFILILIQWSLLVFMLTSKDVSILQKCGVHENDTMMIVVCR